MNVPFSVWIYACNLLVGNAILLWVLPDIGFDLQTVLFCLLFSAVAVLLIRFELPKLKTFEKTRSIAISALALSILVPGVSIAILATVGFASTMEPKNLLHVLPTAVIGSLISVHLSAPMAVMNFLLFLCYVRKEKRGSANQAL